MSENKNAKVAYILWPTLSGTISFFIGGVIVDIILLRLDIYILGSIIAGGIGGLLLGLLLRKRHNIGRMTIAGIVAVPVGFWVSFFLGYAFSEIPFIANSRVPDVLAFILMGALVGGLFGAIIYGRKSIWLFAAVGGILSIPLGSFVDALNWGRFDNLLNALGIPRPNLLPFIVSFGIGIGLSIGLYEMLKQRRTDPSSGV